MIISEAWFNSAYFRCKEDGLAGLIANCYTKQAKAALASLGYEVDLLDIKQWMKTAKLTDGKGNYCVGGLYIYRGTLAEKMALEQAHASGEQHAKRRLLAWIKAVAQEQLTDGNSTEYRAFQRAVNLVWGNDE